MNCRIAEGMVNKYINHTLPLNDLEDFLEHIENCSSCYDELATYFIVHKAMQQLDEKQEDSVLDFKELLEEDIRKSRRYIRRRKIRRAIAAAAFLRSDRSTGDLSHFRDSGTEGGNLILSEKILLIDGHSILNRAFYGLPDLTNAEGRHTGAVYGFLNIMFRIMEEEKPEYLTVAFDLSAPTFRHKRYEAYKGTRKPMPEELREQVPLIKEMLSAMGINMMFMEGYEADDLLGTVARRSEAKGMDVTILSGDRDLLQLATDKVLIRLPKTVRGKTTIEDYHTAEVIKKYQVTPPQIIELKALMGDSSDNIPGIPGVGEKTATKMIVQFGSIENAHEHLEEVKPNKAKESLREHYDMAQLSKELATINTDSPLEFSYEKAKVENPYTPEAYELCKRLEFKNMLNRFDPVTAADSSMELEFFTCNDLSGVEALFEKAAQKEQVGISVLADPDQVYAVGLVMR